MSRRTDRLLDADNKKLAVWKKALAIPDTDPSLHRRDTYGRVISYSEYGNRESECGWEFDYYPVPTFLGGKDEVSNLRPLNCAQNAKPKEKQGQTG